MKNNVELKEVYILMFWLYFDFDSGEAKPLFNARATGDKTSSGL